MSRVRSWLTVGPLWLRIVVVLAALVVVALRRPVIGALRAVWRRLTNMIVLWVRWEVDRSTACTGRALATFAAWGARRLAPFRTGHGPGHAINLCTRVPRRLLYHLIAPIRHRLVDRIVCGDRAVRAAMDDAVVRVPYRARLDALGVTTALGEDDCARSKAMRGDLTALMLKEPELAAVFDAVRRTSTSAVASARVNGKLDVVTDLIQPSCTAALATYLGIDADDADEVFWWAQLALNRIFLSPSRATATHDYLVESSARAAKDRFAALLQRELNRMTTRKTAGTLSGTSSPDVLGKLVELGRAKDIDSAMAFAISLGPHLAWTTALVLDELLRRQGHVDHAFRAATGSVCDASPERVALVKEALRFNPPGPGVMRFCSAEHELTWMKQPVRRLGTGHVLVFTRSSEFDSRRWEHPLRFDPERFMKDAAPPMAFSTGRHECLGKELAPRLMVCILEPLLTVGTLRRTHDSAGRLSYRLPMWSPLRAGGRWSLPTSMVVKVRSTHPTG